MCLSSLPCPYWPYNFKNLKFYYKSITDKRLVAENFRVAALLLLSLYVYNYQKHNVNMLKITAV